MGALDRRMELGFRQEHKPRLTTGHVDNDSVDSTALYSGSSSPVVGDIEFGQTAQSLGRSVYKRTYRKASVIGRAAVGRTYQVESHVVGIRRRCGKGVVQKRSTP